jgi:parallel beta-helix repeat protein
MQSRCCRAHVGFLAAVFLAGCGATQSPVISIKPGPEAQKQTQTALINAKPGTIIEFEEGKFDFTAQLSLTNQGVTIRGKGMDKTILSFKNQDQGSEGILVTADDFTVEDLAVEDAKGDAIKVNGVEGVVFRNVRAEWTEGPKPTNGAYGLYPVQCKQVLIEGCVAKGASDAGIYVGQSQNIIVRNCRAEGNVAGIEIENSTDADVYNNVATGNTGGLMVFDLPGLPAKNGRRIRLFDNKVYENNHDNFAPPGNIVATVPPGTGLMIMATDDVEAFKNEVKDNKTSNVSVISYLFTMKPYEDKDYDPIPEAIYVHDNVISGGGSDPSGRMKILAQLVGSPFPEIIYDGVIDESKLVDGKLPPDKGVYFANNGDVAFANLEMGKLDKSDLLNPKKLAEHKISRDMGAFSGELPPLKEVKLAIKGGSNSAAGAGGD